jgi:hypothetical protein
MEMAKFDFAARIDHGPGTIPVKAISRAPFSDSIEITCGENIAG